MTKRKPNQRAKTSATAPEKAAATATGKSPAATAKVGIILVAYNRSDVTNLALDSLARAQNEHTSFKLFLIDNASKLAEFERIERLFKYLVSQGRIDGELVRNASNLGYAGGNNLGIRSALQDPSITHLSLLNNDVIVTDGWLDRLVEQADLTGGMVGPISNSVGNEQMIPVPYKNHGYNGYSRQAVLAFAKEWAPAHRGNLVETRMLGFFCVLAGRKLFETVGLLDEQFGIGYFEDDDYCLRCTQAGFRLSIAREVFIHHWGSATFAGMERPAHDELFQKNRKLFESKHGIEWQTPVDIRWQRAMLHELSWLAAQAVPDEQQIALIKDWSPRLGILRAIEPNGQAPWQSEAPPPFVPLRVRLMDDLIDAVRLISPRLSALMPPLRTLVEKSKRMPGADDAASAKTKFKSKSKSKKAKEIAPFANANTNANANANTNAGSWQQRRRRGAETVIVLPIQGYDGRRQRPQHLADGLAKKGFDVLWIDPKLGPKLEEGAVPTPEVKVLPSGVLHVQLVGLDPANFYTSGLVPSELAPLLEQLAGLMQSGQRLEDAALLVQSPFWTALAAAFPGQVVYDCMDFHAGFGSATLEVELLETELLRTAHEVVVSSDHLYKTASELDPELQSKLHLIRNGCAPADFMRGGRSLSAADFAARPVIGYFGAVAEWFDHELLIATAQALPEMKFEIIGDHHWSALGKLELPPNLKLLGEQPYEKLPELVTTWKAALIPFQLTELIRATNPVKLYEYSALGLPVVATPIPEVMQSGLEVYIGANSTEFAKAIQTAVATDSSAKIQQRRQFAERNSWAARVEQLTPLVRRIGADSRAASTSASANQQSSWAAS